MAAKSYKTIWQGVALPIVIIIIWIFVPGSGETPSFVFPPLESVLRGFVDFLFGTHNLNVYSGTMLTHLAASIYRVMVGFGIATSLGLLAGYLSGCSQTAYRMLNPTINFFRSIPGIAWLPISIVWFGVGNDQSIFLISLAAFFPVYTNTCHGAKSVDRELIDVSNLLGAGHISSFAYVILPLSLHDAAVGIRVGLGLSWAYLVLGEMTGVNTGIGAVLQNARMLGQINIIIVCMLVIALTAAVFDVLMRILLKAVLPDK